MTKTSIQTRYSILRKMLAALAIAVSVFLWQGAVSASAQTIVDEWDKVQADKFFKTDLEKILNDKGIKMVVIVGTAAQGAVLNTASQAAFRGLQVIIPVDGMSAENTYFEQYTAYHLANSPGVGQQVTLTKIDLIK